MSEANVEIVKLGTDAFNRLDVDASAEFATPDFEKWIEGRQTLSIYPSCVGRRGSVLAVLVTIVLGAISAPTASATGAPVNTAPPTIKGEAFEGRILKDSPPGSWQSNSRLYVTFEWLRCDFAGGNCRTIKGAGARHYILTRRDAGRTVRVRETVRNSEGVASPAVSAATPVVQAAGTGVLKVQFSVETKRFNGWDIMSLTNHEPYCVEYSLWMPEPNAGGVVGPGRQVGFGVRPSHEGESAELQFFQCRKKAGHPPLAIVSFKFRRGYRSPPTIRGH